MTFGKTGRRCAHIRLLTMQHIPTDHELAKRHGPEWPHPLGDQVDPSVLADFQKLVRSLDEAV